jgi:hypothetical protein
MGFSFSYRDAVQAFAGALQERYPPETPEPDATKTKNRLKAVITTYKPYLGNRRSAVLDALVELWAADIALIQRQTHANERADKPLGAASNRLSRPLLRKQLSPVNREAKFRTFQHRRHASCRR